MSDGYDFRAEAKFGHLAPFDVAAEARGLEPWVNQTLTTVDGTAVRMAVIAGEFHWHKHDDCDECFVVLEGELHVDVEGGETVVLGPQQGFSVPKGVVHRTRAPRRTVMLVLDAVDAALAGD